MILLLFAGRILPSLSGAWDRFKTGTLWKKYAADNPLEAQRVDTYWEGGSFPSPFPRSATGIALTHMAQNHRGDTNG